MERGRMRNDKVRLDKRVGGNIRRERELRKITRDELAEVIDLTTSHLGLIERGERGATSVTLEKIVRAFGVSIDSLFAEPSKALYAREKRQAGVFRKKVNALISHLTEAELKLLTHTIKGIVDMRKSGNSSDENSLDEIFDEDDL